MKTIVYVSPFVPQEWIAAHGFQPSRVLLEQTKRAVLAQPAAGVCPFARAFIAFGLSLTDESAIVATTECDQMRRAAELLAGESSAPLFLLNVPTTWQTTTAHRLYISELERLSAFMVRLGGKAPTKEELTDVMLRYDALRAEIRGARGSLSGRAYSEAISRFHREGAADLSAARAAPLARGVPLALLGGPLTGEHFRIFDLIEEAGGQVVLDGTETGERTLPRAFERRRLHEDPFPELADAYFGTIPDAFRRPNSQLYHWLKGETARRGIRGIILRRYLWCDTWHAEVQRMKEWSPAPVLDLDAGDDDCKGRAASRIQSFVAMLK